jgi:hypothetical protein
MGWHRGATLLLLLRETCKKTVRFSQLQSRIKLVLMVLMVLMVLEQVASRGFALFRLKDGAVETLECNKGNILLYFVFIC